MSKEEIYLIIFWEKSGFNIKKAKKNIENEGYECELTKGSIHKDDQLNFIKKLYFKSITNFDSKIDRVGLNNIIVGIVKDKKPNYQLIATSRGYANVNSNITHLKQKLRNQSNIKDGIHISDTKEESFHNIFVAFSQTYENIKNSLNPLVFKIFKVNNIEDVFKLLNVSLRYVVQRNFHEIDNISKAKHGDIDLLLDDPDASVLLLGASPATNDSTRKLYKITFNNDDYLFDLRSCTEGYYDPKWAESILKNRKLSNCSKFYVPSDKDLYYMVAYHAFFHKFELSKDYLDFLKKFSVKKTDKNLNSWADILSSLSRFLQKNKYQVSIPIDKTVKLNPFHFMASGLQDNISKTRVDFLPEHHARNISDLIKQDHAVLHYKKNKIAEVKVLVGKKEPLNWLVLKIVNLLDVTFAPHILFEHEKIELVGDLYAPKVFSSFFSNGTYHILMQRIHGSTLDKMFINEPKFLIDNYKKISAQLFKAARCLIEKKISHRDIREANIFITKNAEVKLIDFGLSCSVFDTSAPIPVELANTGNDETDFKRINNLLINFVNENTKSK